MSFLVNQIKKQVDLPKPSLSLWQSLAKLKLSNQ